MHGIRCAAFPVCLLLVLTAAASLIDSEVAGEPVLGVIDLHYSSPALEITPARDPLEGDFVRVTAHVELDGTQNWTKRGVVLDKGNPGDPDDTQVSAPFVMYTGGEYKMWYVGDPGSSPTSYIMFANSTDGVTWTKHGTVLSPSGLQEQGVHYPGVILDGSTYKMWYGGSDGTYYRIFYATSPDGLSWTRQGLALDLGPPGAMDDSSVFAPFVLREGSTYKMWYTGGDGSNNRVMYVESNDGINWGTRELNLDLGTPGSEESAHVQFPHILVEGGTYHLWYVGQLAARDRIFYATSADGKTWTRLGKVVDLGPPGSTDDGHLLMPRILHESGKPYQMWYAGKGTLQKIHHATFDLPITLPVSASVDFYLDMIGPGTNIGSSVVQVGALAPSNADMVWLATPAGGHVIYAVIDEANSVDETNESNNVASLAVRVVANSPPVADAGNDQSVFRNSMVVLDGSATYDPEGDPITYLWIQTAGLPMPMFGSNTSTPLVVTYLSGFYTFLLTAYDDRGGISTDITNVTVTNRPPTADAGPDISVAKRTLVILDGFGSSDPDSDFLSYDWIQTGGSPVTLYGMDTPNPTFMPVTAGLRTFRLTVDDGDNGVDNDSVQVNVTNLEPIASAGSDMTVRKNTPVTLDGTGSNDSDGDILSYFWTQTGGPGVTLSRQNSETATFTPSVAAIYTFSLSVSDGNGGTDSDSVQVNATNSGPVANAGMDFTSRKRSPVILDGTGSYDLDGDAITFLWTQIGGPPVIPMGMDTATPTFTPLRAGLYEFRLNVTDADGVTGSDQVGVSVTNSLPRAYAGLDFTAKKKTIVTLDGGGSSDPDLEALTYAWSQNGGLSVIIVDADNAVATFTPLMSGNYLFELTVADGDGGISVDSVQVTVINTDPLAEAGPDLICGKGTLVSLDGTSSFDSDGDVLSFVWTQTSGPTVSLAGMDTYSPSFTPASVGTYKFRLAVDDGDGGTDTDTVFVVVYGMAPTARLTASVPMAQAGSSIGFDASQSTDSDGTIDVFRFEFGDGVNESTSSLSASHTYYEPGIYTVTLTVVDNDGNTSTAKVTVRILAAERNLLADIWWLIAIIVILAANVVYFALEWRRWRGKATKIGLDEPDELEPPQSTERNR